MNASEETKVTNVGSQVRRYLDHSNSGWGGGAGREVPDIALHFRSFWSLSSKVLRIVQLVGFFLFQQIDKVFNNIGADLLTGGESENKEDGLQNKQKRVSFFTVLLTFIFILYDFYKP